MTAEVKLDGQLFHVDVTDLKMEPTTRSLIEGADGEMIPGLKRKGEITIKGCWCPVGIKVSPELVAADEMLARFSNPVMSVDEVRAMETRRVQVDEVAKLFNVPAHMLAGERKKMKVRNRFYVASPNVTSEREQAQDNLPGAHPRYFLNDGDTSRGSSGLWTRKNLKDAVAHAEAILEKDRDTDHVAIVQIVRVVRRKKAPVVVEVVK